MSLDDGFGVEARVDGYALLCDGYRPNPEATWPTAAHKTVIAINNNSRSHRTSPASIVLACGALPAQLQLGVPGSTHTPPDAVSVWTPTPSPTDDYGPRHQRIRGWAGTCRPAPPL